jgi:hypothetical protein
MAGKPNIPYGELIIIIVGLIITVLLLLLISNVISIGCGKFRPGIIVEAFSEDKSYFDKLEQRLIKLDNLIEKTDKFIDTITNNMDDFNSNVCYVTKQIDDSLQSNYVSNVPEAEYKLPKDVQTKRANERKERSKKYVANLKGNFIKGKKDIQMIECFENEDDNSAINDNLNTHIDETTANLKTLADKFTNTRKTVSDKQLGMYYISLAYNDKYIKQSVKVVNSLNEGFANEVLDFTKLPPYMLSSDMSGADLSTTTKMAPITKIELLEDNYESLTKNINILGKIVQIIKNTIELQQKTLKASTAIVNDEKTQKDQMNATFSKKSANQDKTS